MTDVREWVSTYDNVTELARFLIDFGSLANRTAEVSELQDFYEKPWNWTDEWLAYQATVDPTTGEVDPEKFQAKLDELQS